jgi:hypothetical protein
MMIMGASTTTPANFVPENSSAVYNHQDRILRNEIDSLSSLIMKFFHIVFPIIFIHILWSNLGLVQPIIWL